MNLRNLDLNLLLVFEAVYQHRRLAPAAASVGLSQPALSNALSRLRNTLGDPLFVRSAKGLVPTHYAQELAAVVHSALGMLGAALEPNATFDAESSEVTFTLLLSDVGELLLLPELIRHVRHAAPNCRLRVLERPRADYTALMEAGEADLAIGDLPMLKPTLFQTRLFTDRYIAVCRKIQDGTSHTAFSLETYFSRPHLNVNPAGFITQIIDQAAHKTGRARQVCLEVQHYFAAERIVLNSDLIATLPARVASIFAFKDDLELSELPFAVSPLEVRAYWHARRQQDPAHVWLRDVVTRLFRESGPLAGLHT